MRTQRTSRRSGPGTVTVVVIGAGHAGLAMSRNLTQRSIDHVVLERGEIANSWRCERWDSLRLLTPNWQCRLPGHVYRGSDPDGYMTVGEVIDFIATYARIIDAPIRTGTTVTSVRREPGGYRVITDQGTWRCRAVVVASGACNVPIVPVGEDQLPPRIVTVTPDRYRNPDRLPPGGVLVVGASATGLQLADEIRRSGRRVLLAVGEHVRMPRLYRGLDIQRWLDATGLLDQRWDEVDDLVRARRVPSPQLVGTPERTTLDLNALTAAGVELVGKVAGVRDGRIAFSGSLRNVCTLADLKLGRLLATIDRFAHDQGMCSIGAAERFAPTTVPRSPRLDLDLKSGEIETIVWATGFRPDYRWLDVPVLDHKARIRHDGGVTDAPGLYVMGLGFLRRRKSSFIHGAGDDATDLADHLHAWLGGLRAARVG
jgi:putative flavoprotein involved in K+ transport